MPSLLKEGRIFDQKIQGGFFEKAMENMRIVGGRFVNRPYGVPKAHLFTFHFSLFTIP